MQTTKDLQVSTISNSEYIMKKLIERLIAFFVVGPLIISAIYFFPHYNFLMFHIMMVIVGIVAVFEIYNILSQKLAPFPKTFISILGIALVISSYFIGLGLIKSQYLFDIFGLLILLIFIGEFIFSFNGNFTKSIARVCAGIFMLVYPWGLMVYLSAITSHPNASQLILIFFLMVFGCDSIAWFFGMLLGKTSRGFVKASPKKSIAGFFGGFIGSITIAFIAHLFFPKTFGAYLPQMIVIAILTALFSIIGDIIESILKRSAGLKDSGNVIMGRGGILDSIDSILIAAPIYYISVKFLIGGF